MSASKSSLCRANQKLGQTRCSGIQLVISEEPLAYHKCTHENKDKKLTDEEHWFDLYLQFALVFVYYSLTTKRLIVSYTGKEKCMP